jgi:hypothetical protein
MDGKAWNHPFEAACPPPVEIRSALKRMLASPHLHLSERNRHFLEFVVNETLEGRGDRIKAYVIGVDVFGRGEDFDPGADPIVRIEATRIRSALASYYQRGGSEDPVRILLRPGSYSPAFERLGAAATSTSRSALVSATATRAMSEAARPVIILACRGGGGGRSAALRAEMLLESVAGHLVRDGLRVFTAPQRDPLEPGVVLEIIVRPILRGHRYRWTLSNVSTGQLLWSDAADQVGTGLPEGREIETMARRAASAVAFLIER